MVIAIQQGLESIKDELESRGHEVFYIGENRMVDAVIYKETDTHPYYTVNNIPSASASLNGEISYGALLVNVTNKSIEDIIRILEKRVYSSLF